MIRRLVLALASATKVRADETLPIVLTLRRDGTQQTVTYLPRGAPFEDYRWVRNVAAPTSACRF